MSKAQGFIYRQAAKRAARERRTTWKAFRAHYGKASFDMALGASVLFGCGVWQGGILLAFGIVGLACVAGIIVGFWQDAKEGQSPCNAQRR